LDTIATEDLFFAASRDLSAERSVVHLMLSDVYRVEPVQLEKLSTLESKLSAQVELLMQKTEEAVQDTSLRKRFTFVVDEIMGNYDMVKTLVEQLSMQRKHSVDQAQLPLGERDSSVKATSFDVATSLIETMHVLRQGTHFIPRRNEFNIDHLQVLRVANWQFSEAIAKEATLISGMLASGAMLSAEESQEIESLHLETLNTWETLRQYMKKQGAVPELAAMIVQIESRFFNEFVELRQVIMSDFQPAQGSFTAVNQWMQVAERTTTLLDELDVLNSQQIRKIASEVEAQGFRNLVIDSAIVLICLLIGVGVVGVLRKIQHLATHDGLTGLPNRIRYEAVLQQSINHNENQSIAVIFVDLDGFKNVNDTLGHEVGDRLLQKVAERLTACISDRGVVARSGGDEFSILVTGNSDKQALTALAHKLSSEINKDCMINNCNLRIGASIGLSVFPEDASTANELKRNADFAMYYARSQGRNNVCSFDQEIASIYHHRLELKVALKEALDQHQFELMYQPQVSSATNAVAGVEALIRWRHPQKGMIPPDMFIPLAEESGQIQEIGSWVLDEACRQMASWQQNGLGYLQVAVNVCAMQFMRPDFIDQVERICKHYELDPSSLELEITESVLVTDVQQVIDTCHRLRALGIRIAIDDFGTGYSSLSYLQDLPVDTLKIDRAFVSGVNNATSKSVAKTIVTLARACGLETVAEGVETNEQLGIINELGCDYIQGYFYSKPVTPEELPDQVDSINQRCIELSRAA
jgi:diguanylate cyclase (GGDEF)-like protein